MLYAMDICIIRIVLAKTLLRGPHIHSTAGRGGRVGHDNKGLNEIDSQCVGRENSFQNVRYQQPVCLIYDAS